MRKQMRQAKNVRPGMITTAYGNETEVVEVRLPQSRRDGVIIVTTQDRFRLNNGRHFHPTTRVPVLR